MKYFLTLLIIFLLTSCNKDTSQASDKDKELHVEENHEHDDEAHSHVAPYGGILTELDGHNASLEWLIEDKQLKIYILDGCAEKPIRISQKEIKVSIKEDEEKLITLIPVTNKLTGEKPGDSNTFIADVENFSKEKISTISVHSVKIQGIDYNNVNLKVK